MYFEIIGELSAVETIATGSGIRELARLRKRYGRGRWRKRKRIARVRLASDEIILAELHRYEATGDWQARVQDQTISVRATHMARTSKELVICVKNEGYSVSLERRMLYVALPDAKAAEHGQLRVIDESGEDYLYPREFFVAIELPQPLRRRVLHAA